MTLCSLADMYERYQKYQLPPSSRLKTETAGLSQTLVPTNNYRLPLP